MGHQQLLNILNIKETIDESKDLSFLRTTFTRGKSDRKKDCVYHTNKIKISKKLSSVYRKIKSHSLYRYGSACRVEG